MNGFSNKPLNQKVLDPTKRVKYTLGMMLGPEEFQQNLAYLMERDRLHNRSLHGYGTVCGLKVVQRPDPDDPTMPASPPQILVQPGIAVNPQGQFVRVPVAQCSDLHRWLDAHESEVYARFGSPVEPDHLRLYVVLCFAECESDATFVPGGPCRTQEETIVPSRISDSFELKLALDPPAQVEEAVVERFGLLLRRIEITADADQYTSLDELEELVWSLVVEPITPEPSSPPESPLEAAPPLFLHPDTAAEILDQIFLLWVTEVRPNLLQCGKNCAGGPPDEECVLLAEVSFDLNVTPQGHLRVDGEVAVDETSRPILLHTRLLQEQLLFGAADRYALNDLTDVEALPSVSGEVLTWDEVAGMWVAASPADVVTDHDELSGLADDDHPQYLLVDQATRALASDLDAAGNKVVNLDDGAAPGEALIFDQAAGGDLVGTYPDPIVDGLQGRPVSDAAPDPGNVLTWDDVAGMWVAASPADGVTDHDELGGLADDDHPQYLLVDQATRALASDLDAAGNKVVNLDDGAAPGEALIFDQAAGGDLGGAYPDPTVDGLQGRPVSNAAPQPGNVLTWDGGRWSPEPEPLLPFVTITRLDNRVFDLWFNIDAPRNLEEIEPGTLTDALLVFRENPTAPTFLTRIPIQSVDPVARNRFEVRLQQESEMLRFQFDLDTLALTAGMSLAEHCLERSIRFVGQDGRLRSVTQFVRVLG